MKLPRAILSALLSLSILLPAALPASAAEAPGPSPWAAEGVQKAIALGMVPENLQRDWQQDMTRREFAQLAVCFLAVQYGYGVGGLHESAAPVGFMNDYMDLRPGPDGRPFGKTDYYKGDNPDNVLNQPWHIILDDYMNVFDDVDESSRHTGYIHFAYLTGMINGRGDGRYDPNGIITRQEAAALLARTYGFYGTLEPREAALVPFTDQDAIADWALEDVTTMQSWGILNGDENGAFLPGGHYTREQGVAAFMRLYESMPVSRAGGTLAPLLTQAQVEERYAADTFFRATRFRAETEICTVVCVSYGGMMAAPGPDILLIYPNSTMRIITLPVWEPQNYQVTEQGTKLTFTSTETKGLFTLDLQTRVLSYGEDPPDDTAV